MDEKMKAAFEYYYGIESDECDAFMKAAWEAAWKASRAALVIELPDTVANTGTLTSAAVLGYKRECRAAIEAQCVKVAP